MDAKYNYLFNDPQYIVKKIKVRLRNGIECYKFKCRNLDISDMFFIKRDDNTFEPFMFNVKKSKNGAYVGNVIRRGTIAYDFIQSIHYTERVINQKTKVTKDGNLSLLQWYFGIKIITSAIEYNKERWDIEVSRQFGKTHLAARIAAFLPVFAPLYANLPNDRWWQIIASYNDDSVKEIFDLKVKPNIFKNIELFNKKRPGSTLIFGRHKSENFVNDKNKLEIRRVINDEAVAYSYVVAISTNTVKDGKSADWMWCDEAWRTNAKEFRRGILPFLSTGGDLLVSGITTPDTENLMYNIHFEVKNSTPLISNCFLTYNFLIHDYPKRAKNLREMAEEEFDIGIESNESQTNYILNWDIVDSDKFYSLDKMRRNNNFANKESLLDFSDLSRSHRVAGLDLATINDYCVLTIWDVYSKSKPYIDELGNKKWKTFWKNQLREIITYNLDRVPISAEDVAERVARHCKTYEIDMIMIDGTSHQRTHNEWIYKEIRNLNINTLVCPYDFSGDRNKVILMKNYEEMLRSGLVVFGSEDELKKHRCYNLMFKETIKLFKGYEGGKKNIQYKAKGKKETDDHVMSCALGCYCVPYIEFLEKSNKFIRINSYEFRAKLNKFSYNSLKQEVEMPKTYINII